MKCESVIIFVDVNHMKDIYLLSLLLVVILQQYCSLICLHLNDFFLFLLNPKMNCEYFDLALEGTTINDMFTVDKNQKTVVLDFAGNYGTTYSSLSNLEKSPYISDFKIIRDKRKNNEKVLIESIPFILGAKDQIIQCFGINAFGEQLGFVDINEVHFISDIHSQIPTNKNEIAATDLSNSDLYYFYKSIKEKDLGILKDNFQDKKHPLYRALVIKNILDGREFSKICENFGRAPFVYPLYGLGEISESAALVNSFKGVIYVLNSELKHEIHNENEYKHTFTCDVGTIFTKEFKPRILDSKKQFVKVILTEKKKFGGNFLAFIDSSNDFKVNVDGDVNSPESEITKVIGIYSDAEVCPDGYQLLYFIKDNTEIIESDLRALSIFNSDIVLEINFKTKYNLEPKYC